MTMDTDTVARILAAHDAGQGWSAIARALNDDGVPTAGPGGMRRRSAPWWPDTPPERSLSGRRPERLSEIG